ncbi:amino acid deaminase, partial [Pseudomonas syringae pv. actinidiae]|nr:amino acid deaminase [Pseudomonas syringae pv. actinidiae]
MSTVVMDTAVMNIAVMEKGSAQPGDRLLSDVSLPALVIHNQALEHNIRWMQRFV